MTSLSYRLKSYGSNSGFHVFGDLDLLPMFYLLPQFSETNVFTFRVFFFHLWRKLNFHI